MKPDKPITRLEQYLASIAGDNTVIPEKPITRIEQYLDYIAMDAAELNEIVDSINKNPFRYGVAGVGQQAADLTRIWDSVGMVAQVGTDGDNSGVVNNFDNAAPFMRKKCVGSWSLDGGRAKFTVNAYLGDSNYTEDGTQGDYVAVECPICYYYFEDGILGISAHKYEGWRPFDIFCRNHDEKDTIDKVYIPAYALAIKDGHAVSLPGYDNEQGSYKSLTDAVRTYNGGGVENIAHLEPAALNFYEWALFTVEFATQNCQSIMAGCTALRSADSESVQFVDSTHILTSNYQAARVAGEYVAITKATGHTTGNYKATHRIVSVVRCDGSGNASSSGNYQLIELEDLGKGYYTYNTTDTYYIAGRPYRTGSCNTVSTPSGSPVNNTNGYYPCKYRWRENPYGNQYKTAADLFNSREGTGDNDYYLKWYLLLDPSAYIPQTTDNPNIDELAGDDFALLDVQTAHANYVNGYIKSKKYSELYPDIWIPFVTTGGSATTYICDYAYLVNSPRVRAVRFGGHWYNDGSAGFSAANASNAPSYAAALFGGDLCFPQ